MTEVNTGNLIHTQEPTPVARVHIYRRGSSVNPKSREEAKLPKHWCGPDYQNTNKNFRPFAIVGKQGSYIGANGNALPMEWSLLACQVNLTRQWDCSSARFEITRELYPGVFPRQNVIRPGDVVVIEMGYTSALNSDIVRSLTDQRTDYNVFSGDVVFYGKVDTIVSNGGSGLGKNGLVWTIKARDPISYLIDNKMKLQYAPSNNTDVYNRAYVVRDLINRGAAIDYVEWETTLEAGTNRTIYALAGEEADASRGEYPGSRKPKIDNGLPKEALFRGDNCYLNFGNIEYSHRQLPLKTDGTENIMQMAVMDKFPLDVIKHFSLVEIYPRELFANRRTGNIHWEERRTDMRKLLNKEHRASRQYFYMFPAERANIINYKMEWSTAGTVTHFTILGSRSSGGEKGVSIAYAESSYGTLKDPSKENSYLGQQTINRFVFDDTLSNTESPGIIAQSLFNIWGRAIQTGIVMVPGDPTLEIGEAIQVFNTDLFGKRVYDTRVQTANKNPNLHGGIDTDQTGLFRVEGVAHLFAVGGVKNGYMTSIVLGPVDLEVTELEKEAFQKHHEQMNKITNGKLQVKSLSPRLIVDDKQLKEINLIQTDKYGDV